MHRAGSGGVAPTSRDWTESCEHGRECDHGVHMATRSGRGGVDERGEKKRIRDSDVRSNLICPVAHQRRADLSAYNDQGSGCHGLHELKVGECGLEWCSLVMTLGYVVVAPTADLHTVGDDQPRKYSGSRYHGTRFSASMGGRALGAKVP